MFHNNQEWTNQTMTLAFFLCVCVCVCVLEQCSIVCPLQPHLYMPPKHLISNYCTSFDTRHCFQIYDSEFQNPKTIFCLELNHQPVTRVTNRLAAQPAIHTQKQKAQSLITINNHLNCGWEK